MRRFILTGTPGAGKTMILRLLEASGYGVVEEAATAVIALAQTQGTEVPWTSPLFHDRIVALQRQRQLHAATADVPIQFHDRSPVCTHALARYADAPVSAALAAELDRIARDRVYQRQVFFVRNLGFVTPTTERRITLPDALRFERIHQESYREFGYELVDIPPGPLPDRVAAILAAVG